MKTPPSRCQTFVATDVRRRKLSEMARTDVRGYRALKLSPPCLTLFVGLVLVGCGKESPPPTSAPGTNASASGVVAPPTEKPSPTSEGYLQSLARAQKSAVKTIDLAALTQAIEMFQVDKGRWPKDLNELVDGKFIGQIPPAPAGMKIVYDPVTGEVKTVKE